MIIGEIWQNQDDKKKKKMISVFEEYIAKNYIKRFIKAKNLKFDDLEEKIIGDYKIVQTNLTISENEKVSLNIICLSKGKVGKFSMYF